MEVCIFGVLTVNLLTFPSRNAPSPFRTLLSRKPVFQMAGLTLEEKA